MLQFLTAVSRTEIGHLTGKYPQCQRRPLLCSYSVSKALRNQLESQLLYDLSVWIQNSLSSDADLDDLRNKSDPNKK